MPPAIAHTPPATPVAHRPAGATPGWASIAADLLRPGPPPPGWARVAGLVVGGAVVFSVALGVAGTALHDKPHHYFGERRVGTLSTVAALGVAAAVCLRIARQIAGTRFGQFWRAFGVLLIVAACDDLFRIHEYLDRIAHAVLGWDPNDKVTDRLDDAIVGLYGVVAVWLWGRHARRLLRLRWMMVTLAVAFAGFAVMVACDALHVEKVIEESTKNVSAALIVAAMLAAKWDPRLPQIAGTAVTADPQPGAALTGG